MDVAVGEAFEITLPDLPGAGYRWSLSTLPEGVRMLSDNSTPITSPPERTGSAQPRTFVLQAARDGRYELRFLLLRPRGRSGRTPPPAAEHVVSVAAS
jgi:predicted secreted protein